MGNRSSTPVGRAGTVEARHDCVVAGLPRFRRLRLAPILIGLTAGASVPLPATAWAQTTQQLSPGQAVRLTAPGVVLQPLADGRLASYGIEVEAGAVAFATQAGVGSEAVSAAPGAQLVVLHVVTSEHPGDANETVLANATPSLVVRSGNLSAPLQVQTDSYPSPDDAYFAAAVPAGGPAVLTLSEAGLLPQSLDLRTGRRVGSSPSVLYRALQAPAVTVRSSALSSFSASAGTSGTASGQFGVATAYLSYWQPYSTTMASGPSEAYLDVEFAPSGLSLAGSGYDLGPAQALPAGSVTFGLPDGRTVTASNDIDPAQQTDVFSGDFYAQIPADTTSVEVTVTLTTLPVQVGNPNPLVNQDATLHFAAPLTAEITLPPAPTMGAPASAAGPARPASGSALPVVLAVVAFLVMTVLAATLYWSRRRRLFLPARPVTWPPVGLPPASALLLDRGPMGALPAAPDAPPNPTVPIDDVGSVAPGPAPALAVNAFGPLGVEGLVQPIQRKSVRRLLVALALIPERPLSADELGLIISDRPERRDPKTQSVNSYASILRRSLPAGVLPDAGAGGYRLDPDRVVVDWHVVDAVAAQPSDSPGWAGRADAALDLVRGRPLEGGSWEGIEPVVRVMIARVDDLGHRLAGMLLADGDAAGAERAVKRGLVAAVGSVRLWQDRLDAAAGGSGYGLERAWDDARALLGADAGLLASHYQQLRRNREDDPTATT